MKSFQKTVILTGGPMGGKTEFMAFAKDLIAALNRREGLLGGKREYRLLVQPEIASLLYNAGVALEEDPKKLEGHLVQELVTDLRREIADGLDSLGKAWLSEREDRVLLLLLDRGGLDPLAFEEVPSKSPGILARGVLGIDAIFHLRSLAIEKPKTYSRATNEARTMDVAKAQKIDRQLEAIYSEASRLTGVPHHIITNHGDFTDKKMALGNLLLSHLLPPRLPEEDIFVTLEKPLAQLHIEPEVLKPFFEKGQGLLTRVWAFDKGQLWVSPNQSRLALHVGDLRLLTYQALPIDPSNLPRAPYLHEGRESYSFWLSDGFYRCLLESYPPDGAAGTATETATETETTPVAFGPSGSEEDCLRLLKGYHQLLKG